MKKYRRSIMKKIPNAAKISDHVFRVDDKYWQNYYNPLNLNKQSTGKYLFFSEDKKALEEIIIDELGRHGFYSAKINTDEYKRGPENVLCLYAENDSKKKELWNRYAHKPKVRYRYWKSNEDTRKRKYSSEFIQYLKPEEKQEYSERSDDEG